jgi:tRNA (adenine22-N1)-methyltransferase
MPRLDERLKTVARQIRSDTHVDVGSDHGHLLLALLKAGRIRKGIAIENKQLPFENSTKTLIDVNAEVRFGSGLDVYHAGEAESLSICGLGAKRIVEILDGHPERVPDLVILQPNKRPDLVRRWGLRNAFFLMDESSAGGPWPYTIFRFCRANLERQSKFSDPAYEGIDLDMALHFGPILLKRHEAVMLDQLREEREYLLGLDRLGDFGSQRLTVLQRVLAAW